MRHDLPLAEAESSEAQSTEVCSVGFLAIGAPLLRFSGKEKVLPSGRSVLLLSRVEIGRTLAVGLEGRR